MQSVMRQKQWLSQRFICLVGNDLAVPKRAAGADVHNRVCAKCCLLEGRFDVAVDMAVLLDAILLQRQLGHSFCTSIPKPTPH